MIERLLYLIVPLIIIGSIGAAFVLGVRRVVGRQRRDPIEPAQIAISAAIFGSLLIAFLVATQGVIEVLQGFVDLTNAIDNAVDSLAGPLALLIVGVPAFAGLLIAVERRHLNRHKQGITAPQRGWAIYLALALSIALTSWLIGMANIINTIMSDSESVEGRQLVAPIVWASVWALHWFLFRPRWRSRGDLHFAYGSIAGLFFLISGIGGLVFQILDAGYTRAFLEPVSSDQSYLASILTLLVGATVWGWHWLANFNRPTSVEGDRRRSTLWFAVAVLAGALPGALWSLAAIGGSLRALVLWLFESDREPTAEFFSDLPALITILFLGLGSWAYHHWEIQRGPAERNEPLRFRDYVLALTGLMVVAGGIARLLVTALRAVFVDALGADDFEVFDALVTSVIVIAAGAVLWWFAWRNAQAHRNEDPIGEAQSIWRRVFFIGGLALGGITLGFGLIEVLFRLLQWLLGASDASGGDLIGPISWLSGVGLVTWLVFSDWQPDRKLLAEHEAANPPAPTAPPSAPAMPVAPTPPVQTAPSAPARPVPVASGPVVRPAGPDDAGEIFTLTRAALAGQRLDDMSHLEPFAQWRQRQAGALLHVCVEGSRIVGAVTVRPNSEGAGVIERLVVAPDRTDTAIEQQMRAQVGRVPKRPS